MVFSSLLTAQNYQPFPTDSAKWIVEWWGPSPEYPPFGYMGNIQYSIEGDTLINSKMCRKIFSLSWNSALTYYGALFDDTTNKKVYIFNSTIDSLLYDFTLGIGDTIKNTYNESGLFVITICTIDSILIHNIYHKRFNLCGGIANPSIIEGIGCTFGLFEPLDPFEYISRLVCFSENNIFELPSDGNCIVTGIDKDQKKENLKIWPNPVKINTMLNFNFENNDIPEIEFYNSLGIQKKIAKNNRVFISDKEFNPGLYIVKIKYDQKHLFYKLTVN